MPQAVPLMAGKKGLVLGIANDRSLAWGITRAVAEHGAELAITFQGEALAKRVRPLAESIGAFLVDARLAACVNVMPSMTSIYRWEGKLNRESETVMIVKTRSSLAERVINEVRSRHTYANPALTVIPASASSGVRPNKVQAMFIARVGDSIGEVPGLQSVAMAIGTWCLRSSATGGFFFSCSA